MISSADPSTISSQVLHQQTTDRSISNQQLQGLSCLPQSELPKNKIHNFCSLKSLVSLGCVALSSMQGVAAAPLDRGFIEALTISPPANQNLTNNSTYCEIYTTKSPSASQPIPPSTYVTCGDEFNFFTESQKNITNDTRYDLDYFKALYCETDLVESLNSSLKCLSQQIAATTAAEKQLDQALDNKEIISIVSGLVGTLGNFGISMYVGLHAAEAVNQPRGIIAPEIALPLLTTAIFAVESLLGLAVSQGINALADLSIGPEGILHGLIGVGIMSPINLSLLISRTQRGNGPDNLDRNIQAHYVITALTHGANLELGPLIGKLFFLESSQTTRENFLQHMISSTLLTTVLLAACAIRRIRNTCVEAQPQGMGHANNNNTHNLNIPREADTNTRPIPFTTLSIQDHGSHSREIELTSIAIDNNGQEMSNEALSRSPMNAITSITEYLLVINPYNADIQYATPD